ncbi:MAG: phosphoribosyltransferase family protein [Candidatus Thorarchaeota archaeon]
MTWSYRNRTEAGTVLRDMLLREVHPVGRLLVLAIPNGGVLVAEPIARGLHADLDIMIVRKIQIPFNTEAGFGAIDSLGGVLLNRELLASLHLSEEEVQQAIERTRRQIEERRATYGGLVGTHTPSGRDVILVDDGLASGYTMMAAIRSVTQRRPRSLTVAVPTASSSAYELVRRAVDRLLCPRIESGWSFAVAEAYELWYDVSDREVVEVLSRFSLSENGVG